MVSVKEIAEEHKQVLRMIDRLEAFIPLEQSIDKKTLSSVLKEFKSFWKAHEEKEDELFDKIASYDFRNEKMILDQHRQLKGHWKVMIDSLKDKNKDIRVTLDTDGRMLFDKFREHMKDEEAFFSKLDY